MGQGISIVFFRELKDMDSVNASNSQQLDVFFDNKGHNLILLSIFRDLKSFDFLQVIRSDNFFAV